MAEDANTPATEVTQNKRGRRSAKETTEQVELERVVETKTRTRAKRTSTRAKKSETVLENTSSDELTAEEANEIASNAEEKASFSADTKAVKKRNTRKRDKKVVEETVAESLAELAQNKISFSSGEPAVTVPAVRPEINLAPMTALLFQEPDVTRAVRARRSRKVEIGESESANNSSSSDFSDEEAQVSEKSNEAVKTGNENGRKSRRGSRGGQRTEVTKRADEASETVANSENLEADTVSENSEGVEETPKKRVRKRKGQESESVQEVVAAQSDDSGEETTIRRRRRRSSIEVSDEVEAPKGSTRLEAKRQRRKEGREAGRRRQSISESEFLARREAVDRQMLVREQNGLNQIAVIEDGVLVEHYVARHTQSSMVGNVYLGRVQNVLPSMEAAFVDIGKGRNAVLYAGEVNWEAAGLEGKPRKIEDALKSGDVVLVQVTKDPIGHKGARLTGQVTLAGRHLVLVPGGAMTGISRKLPEKERLRLKQILKEVVPAEHGVIVRTAAEGASEDQLKNDVKRLVKSWNDIDAKSKSSKNAPSLLKGEPELAVRVVRDVFNEDFNQLLVEGSTAWETISSYVEELSPELSERVQKWEGEKNIFASFRVDEQLQKAFDRKVFLPSGGSLVIDRTEAMTVIDVNTGKFTGSGGTLEETVTRNNLEAAEEIVRQLRLRDIGGIIVVDFIDMVLEANRDLVLRRLIECLGRDRTRHQVAEVTSLGLVQMTRKRVGQGLVEAFSTTCECCEGRGYISHDQPVERESDGEMSDIKSLGESKQVKKKLAAEKAAAKKEQEELDAKHAEVKAALANIAAAAAQKHEEELVSENGSDNVGEKSAAVLDSESAATESADDAAEKANSEDSHTEVKKRTRRVSSTGTIVPKTSASSAIMTFPMKKD
ncbi:MAG: Rne/Rng family ribonuclease [Arcanobacterium sp.]|nr:Rne/Rng family ribonuclease [Arcanobacterium sp.]